MPPIEQFSAARLRELREASGLSRTQLAARVGRTEQTVWLWERGQVPHPNLFGVIASVLGCAVADLFAPVTDDVPPANGGTPKSVRTHARGPA